MVACFGPLLQRVHIFSELSEAECGEICELVQARHYATDEHLFKQGDLGEEMFLVADGAVRVYIDEDGNETTLATLGEGEVIGEMSLLTGEPRSACAVAVEDSRLLVISKSDFDVHLASNAHVMLEMARVIARRQANTNHSVIPHVAGATPPPVRPAAVADLKIQIDEAEREEEVKEICHTDFFEAL